MRQSGRWAADDVRRAAEQIRDNLELLDRWRDLDRDAFLDDVKSRLNTLGEITRETYDRAIEQSRKVLDKQWEKTGRIGEEHLEALQKHSEALATSLKEQWGVFWDHMEKTGKKIDRAVNAAWEELKKKDQ
jgi:DNA anti-recombination protein RmuC